MTLAIISSSALTPSTRALRCNSITPSFKRDLTAEPNANPGSMAEVQTQGQENMRYVISNCYLAVTAADLATSIMGHKWLSYADVLTLAKINYNGTNAPTLQVAYGLGGSTFNLVGYDGTTTAIPVIIDSFTFPIDMVGSKDGYRSAINISLIETG